jgi:hypothetical protein
VWCHPNKPNITSQELRALDQSQRRSTAMMIAPVTMPLRMCVKSVMALGFMMTVVTLTSDVM